MSPQSCPVWLLPAESGVLPVTFNSSARVDRKIVPIARLPVEQGREAAHAQLCSEEIVFALRHTTTNDATSPVGKLRRTRDATIVAGRKRRDLHD
jgi:hypothetical protein